MATAAAMTVAEADALYEQYGRPLEPDHNGKYLAYHPYWSDNTRYLRARCSHKEG